MDQNQNESRTTSNWRNERYAKMLESGNGADVYFLVGRPGEEKQLIPAHKFVLSAVSDVFEGQFLRFNEMTGTQEGSKEKPIEVPDISPDAFCAFLKFIYAEDLNGINKQTVLDVYSAGEKYMIDAVVDHCRQWLMNLGVDNVLAVLKFGQCHEDKILIEHCWNFVDKNTRAVLKSEEFLLLKEADLCELFSRDTLETNELFLFFNLLRWTNHKCGANCLGLTLENKQKVVGKAIYQIRFPLLTPQQFTEYIVPSGLLTKDDMLAMYIHYGNNTCIAESAQLGDLVDVNYKISVPNKKKFQQNKSVLYPENRFNSQPRASKFRITIIVVPEGEASR